MCGSHQYRTTFPSKLCEIPHASVFVHGRLIAYSRTSMGDARGCRTSVPMVHSSKFWAHLFSIHLSQAYAPSVSRQLLSQYCALTTGCFACDPDWRDACGICCGCESSRHDDMSSRHPRTWASSRCRKAIPSLPCKSSSPHGQPSLHLRKTALPPERAPSFKRISMDIIMRPDEPLTQ